MAEQKIRELKKKMTKLKSPNAKALHRENLEAGRNQHEHYQDRLHGLSPTEIEKEIVDPDQNALRKLYVGKRIT